MQYELSTNANFITQLQEFFSKYKLYIGIGTAFGILTGILILIILFQKLSAVSTRSQERARVIHEILAVFICEAILGGTWIIFQFITTIFR